MRQRSRSTLARAGSTANWHPDRNARKSENARTRAPAGWSAESAKMTDRPAAPPAASSRSRRHPKALLRQAAAGWPGNPATCAIPPATWSAGLPEAARYAANIDERTVAASLLRSKNRSRPRDAHRRRVKGETPLQNPQGTREIDEAAPTAEPVVPSPA